MSPSNFDPANPDSERLGRGGLDRYLGPEAQRGSHLPGEAIDGELNPEEQEDAPEDNNLSHEELPPDEAARRLDQMQRGKNSVEDLPDSTGPIE
ncbi:MAG TPA: hypothetical protein VGQ99_14080 [Tepidisphaeraceae bacterium]|jgi:hypothetical protein|nr:hypothetical protein [Tepidisphaeraceae bacterium]